MYICVSATRLPACVSYCVCVCVYVCVYVCVCVCVCMCVCMFQVHKLPPRHIIHETVLGKPRGCQPKGTTLFSIFICATPPKQLLESCSMYMYPLLTRFNCENFSCQCLGIKTEHRASGVDVCRILSSQNKSFICQCRKQGVMACIPF